MNSFLFSTIKETLDHINSNSSLSHIVFAGVSKINELSGNIGENVILCSTSGEFTSKGYSDGAITGFSFSPSLSEVVEISYPPAKSLKKLQDAYIKVKNNNNAFALLLCDGLSAMEEAIVTSFYFTDPKFKIIGGSAGDNLKFEKTLIYIGSKKVHSAAIFFNIKSQTQLIKENIYVPTGKKLLVTEADAINRTVKTFNNKPASEEYAKALGIKEVDLPKHFMNNPLGKIYKEDIYIASPMKVNPDKSITFYCQLIPNAFVELLKPVDYLKAVETTITSAKFRPSFVLSVHCILRSLKFIEENSWNNISSKLLTLTKNQTGFISYGEQYYRNHFNQTMVLLLIE